MSHRAAFMATVLAIVSMAPVLAAEGRTPAPGCGVQIAPGDTERFVGLSRTNTELPGTLREWIDQTGRIQYAENWRNGADTYLWDGSILFNADGPQAYTARRLRNGEVIVTESAERVSDSLIVSVAAQRTATALGRGVTPIPGALSAPVRMLLIQCALHRPNHELETFRFGRVRADEVGAATIHSGARSQRVRLILLWNSVGDIAARVWVDAADRVIAFPGAEGNVDLLRPEWVSARDQLLGAEVSASSPNCHFGGGPGGCEGSPRVCNVPPPTMTPAVRVRSVTISDSGYSIRSDGRGPYIGGVVNVSLPPVGLVAGLMFRPVLRDVVPRFYVVDLDHPVPGKSGKPLGVIKVDGSFPGRFIPSGANAGDEFLAHANTDWDYQQHSMADIPIGASITVTQIDLDLYIGGVMHVLQMGPQPYGHCQSSGTAIYGGGTTMGTVSHPDAEQWVVDLPRGSVGRLFENRTGDPSAADRGLYYVSLHFVVHR